ncbi:hypothetical protein BGZ83_005639 [Gryganskiella cystojenkinii]|nr:hypothetical protein BGZ83_005639 [Gryganskiella cystojenkinii]
MRLWYLYSTSRSKHLPSVLSGPSLQGLVRNALHAGRLFLRGADRRQYMTHPLIRSHNLTELELDSTLTYKNDHRLWFGLILLNQGRCKLSVDGSQDLFRRPLSMLLQGWYRQIPPVGLSSILLGLV